MTPESLARLLALGDAKVPAALATRLADGAQAVVTADAAEGALSPDPAALAAIRATLAADRSRVLPEHGLFVRIYAPPPRLIIIGAVHVAQALAPMAELLGYDVVVVDPRRSFAAEARFPGVTLIAEWPDEALTALRLDARSAVIALTHDPKLDDPGLDVALASPAFYIGALGSKKTHAARLERLAALGLAPEALARIHGPLGLDLGAATPAEIALAALAQATAVRRRGA